jgi:hypothetical protein
VEDHSSRPVAAWGSAIGALSRQAPAAWGEHRLTYAADPDGTIIGLADAPLSELLAGTLELFPEAHLEG